MCAILKKYRFEVAIFIRTYDVVAVGQAEPHFAARRLDVVVVVAVAAGAVVAGLLDDVGEDDINADVRAAVGRDDRRESRPVPLFEIDLERKKSALPSELHPFLALTSELHPPLALTSELHPHQIILHVQTGPDVA